MLALPKNTKYNDLKYKIKSLIKTVKAKEDFD